MHVGLTAADGAALVAHLGDDRSLDGLRPGDPAWATLGPRRRLPRARRRAGHSAAPPDPLDELDDPTDRRNLTMTAPRRPARPQPACPLTRRALLGRMGVARRRRRWSAPTLLAACGGDDDEQRHGGDGGGGVEGAVVRELAALHRRGDRRPLRGGVRHRLPLHRGLQRQRRVLRQDTRPTCAGQARIGPDIIAPTYWMAARLIGLGWVQELPLDDIPNAANLVPDLQNPAWDPDGQVLSLPWQSGMTGIAYNIAVTGRELTSIDDLFDPEFKGKIGMLTEMRDTVGLDDAAHGDDPAEADHGRRRRRPSTRSRRPTDDGQIRQFTGNEYLDDLATGNFAACIGWSGDIAQLALDNPDLRFVIPEEGGMRWFDTMVIPNGAENVANAAEWMNYVYDPENAARITEPTSATSRRSQGVQEVLAAGDDAEKALAENPLLFPDEATLGQPARLRQPRRGRRRPSSTSGSPRSRGLRPTPMADDEEDRTKRAAGSCPTGCCRPGCSGCSCSSSSRWSRWSGRRCRRSRAASTPTTRRSPGSWRNFTDAISDYREQFIRSFVYAGTATRALHPHRLPAGLLHRVPGRAVPEPAARPGGGAVLHLVPHPHARLADDPRPTTGPVLSPARRAAASSALLEPLGIIERRPAPHHARRR